MDINFNCYQEIIKKITSRFQEYLEEEEEFVKLGIKEFVEENIDKIIDDIYRDIIDDINETLKDYVDNFT
tara:strand:- start:547 stop:756 length:210 start_codon:yes stop_codon:yes gene_type:complete